MQIRQCVVVALTCSFAACFDPSAGFISTSGEKADKFAKAFATGEFAQTAGLFHFPSNYSQTELTQDKNALQAALEFLSTTLGRPNTVRKKSEDSYVAIDFTYQVVVSGGDLPYWETRPLKISSKHLYEADFPNYPDALIYVELIPGSGSTQAEVWKGGVAIPAEKGGSKDYAMKLTEGVAAAMEINFSDEVREFMRERVAPPEFLRLPE